MLPDLSAPSAAPAGRFAASGRAIRSAVGFEPELSSDDAGWKHVALYAWRGECREAEFEPFEEPVVIFHIGGAPSVPIRIDRRWDRRTHPGLVTVIPPRTRIGWDIRGEVHSRSVHLGAGFFCTEEGEPMATPDLQVRCGVRDPLLISSIEALEGELRHPGQHGTLYADSISNVMALHLLREGARPVLPSGRSLLSRARLSRVIERIEDSIEHGVSLQALADEAALSRTYFAAAFRDATGYSPHRYLTRRRLARARELLQQSDLSLAQIALRCGFSSQAHFTEYFRRDTGTTPRAYRCGGN
jgi:AraC family transcriptional regulator